jgi:RNA-directed DNA polymerase
LVSPLTAGTPQGGPLSPLLSNIVLDELDREVAQRGLRFVRYADDCQIYVRSRRAGFRVLASLTRFIANRLKLRVNQQKSAVGVGATRTFLGFSFTAAREPKRRLASSTIRRFKSRIRVVTRRTRGVSIVRMARDLIPYLRGWLGYFGKCQTPSVLYRLEEWLRRRLRSVIWTQWKRGACSRRPDGAKCAWPVAAGSESRPDDCTTQGLFRLTRDSTIDCAPIAQPTEPPYTDPYVRWCDRESG